MNLPEELKKRVLVRAGSMCRSMEAVKSQHFVFRVRLSFEHGAKVIVLAHRPDP
jgi:plasmid stability protein